MNIVKTLHDTLGGPESIWLLITSLGRDEVFIIVIALYAWLVNPRGARALGVAFATSYLANTGLKFALDLPRPFHLDPSVAGRAAQATAGGPGLPSGHAQMTATLWLGMAATLQRRGVWALAIALVVLVSLSRLVLGVHFPSDVVVGLLLGAAFAWVATRDVPRLTWVGAFTFALALLPSLAALAVGLSILGAFLMSRFEYAAPRGAASRLLVGLGGLLLVFAVYFGFRVVPEELRHSGAGTAIRHFLTVLTATELVPLVFRRWMPTRA
ncbi:phosphatase PAP2 family protein [Deinococcus maricopensis]|uniref:Phosphoesterase PA-phosphatase related protein n=1 Tax=Deinococcus maricopensis (strain DSM 21211 / LMG 22137 / NRRL B-23946 / LB-34) TaxID=709986 RepID=E8U960_DEIML|nr:phosphatase PAP2 family protein [Deinococcus maricopensis]ADV67599.1 phosphoesterase PA-phosphatase related protein [Deinococcus maricopensis DSM 21211]